MSTMEGNSSGQTPRHPLKVLFGEVASSWRHPRKRLNLSEEDISKHVDALSEFLQEEEFVKMNDFIVENLNTLDRKAQGLLLLNAIVLAIATIVYTALGTGLSLIEKFVLLVLIAILTASCIFVALLNMAYWTSTDEFSQAVAAKDPDPVLRHLIRLRELRTVIVWTCTGAVIFCLLSIFLLLLSYTIIQNL